MNPNNDEEHPVFPNGFYPSNNGNHTELSFAAMQMLNSHRHPSGSVSIPSRRTSAPASYGGASFTNNNEFNMGSFHSGVNNMGASISMMQQHQHQGPFHNQGMIPNHGSPMRNTFSSGQGVAAASPHRQMNHTTPSGQQQQPSIAATHAAAVRLSLPLPISFPMHFGANVPAATLGIELSLPTNASPSAQSRHPFPPSQFDHNSASLSSPEESDFLAEAILRLHNTNMPNPDLAPRRASADQILLNGIANSMSHRDSFLSNIEPLRVRPSEPRRNNDQGHHEFASSLWNDLERHESFQTTEFDSVLDDDDDDDEISIANPNILREMLLGDDTLHESQGAVSDLQGRRQTTANSAPASSFKKQEDKLNEVVKPLSPSKMESNEEDDKKSILKEQNLTPKMSRKRARSPSPERKRPASVDKNCCICLETTAKCDLAKIDGCDHRYCFTCIEKWAERENTCPQCKARFLKIERVHKVKRQKNEPNEVENVKEVDNRDQRSDLRNNHVNLQDFFESIEQHALQGFNIVFSNGGMPNFDGLDYPGIFMPIGNSFSFANGPASWTTTTTRMFPTGAGTATSFTSTRTSGDLSSPSIRTTHQLTSIRRMQRERMQRERMQRERNARRASEDARFMRERAARIAAMEARRRSNDSSQSSPSTRMRNSSMEDIAFRSLGNNNNPGNNQEQR